MVKKIITLLFLVLVIQLYSQHFEVINQTENELVVKFILPEFKRELISTKLGTFTKIECDDAAYPVESGYPSLPFFTEIIGLPIEGNASFHIIDKKQITIPNIKVYPTDKMTPLEDRAKYEFYMKEDFYNSNANYPSEIIETGSPAYIGDRFFTGFNVHPFQFKPNNNELIVIEELTFRINILGDKIRSFSEGENFIDMVGNSFFLNNDHSKNWRKQKQRADFVPYREGEEINELQLIIDEEGIYKISYEYIMENLAELGFPDDFEMAFNWDEIDPQNLELTCMGNQIPIHFVGEEDGTFDPGDYFEFYGDRHYGENSYYDDFTSESSYFLTLLDHRGSRMAVENGGLGVINSNLYTIPESFQQTIHFEEQNTKDNLGAQYGYNSPDFYREDIWFWDRLYSPSLEIYPFELEYPDQRPTKRFTAQTCLFSITFNEYNYDQINHSAQININTSVIDQHEWNGQAEQMLDNFDNSLPNNYLNNGENNLYVNQPGIPGTENQHILLDYFDVTYWQMYKTDADKIKFTEPQDKPLGLFQFELDNFSNDQISVYKLGTSFIENIHVESFLGNGNPPFKISFQDSLINHNTEYYAVTEEMKKQPVKILPNIPSSLKSQINLANYIVITLSDFKENANLLQFKQKWEEEGKFVKIVYLQDIFDEFNFGIRSAQSIKDFIQYAYNNWSGSGVSHVLFLGDGITDERDDSPNREYNLIPFKNVWVQKWGAIASDNWLGCIVGDDLVPDVSIGRINIWDESQIEGVVNKTIQYIDQPNFEDLWHSHVTLAAGGNQGEGSQFAEQSEIIRSTWIPDEFNVSRVYCYTGNLPNSYEGNTTSLIDNINDGTLYLQFMGHGGGHVWADYNLLNMADISIFNNDNLPFVASFSCYGSAFNTPQSSCLGEELILRPNIGAIGHVGFTGYGYVNGDLVLSRNLTEAIFDKHVPSTGEAVNFAKAKFFASYNFTSVGVALTHGCALLGDPMIQLVLPYDQKQVNLDNYNLVEGDTLIISSNVGPQITNGKFVVFDDDDSQLDLNQYYPFERPVINNTLTVSDFIVPENNNSIYSQYVKLFAYGEEGEVTGMTNFTVGQSAMVDLEIIPDPPGEGDPINIRANFFDEDGLGEIYFVLESNLSTIEMVNVENSIYELANMLPGYSPGDNIYFHFKIFNALGDSTITDTEVITVAGPDLVMEHFELTEYENEPAAKILLRNSGSTEAGFCNLRLYDVLDEAELLSTVQIEPLAVLENRWEYVPIPLLNREIRFKSTVNENDESFSEIPDNIGENNNEIFSDTLSVNMFEVGNTGSTVSAFSLDDNLLCEFPHDFLPEPAIFYINSISTEDPIDQPDIIEILPANQTNTFCYEIGTLDESCLDDSLGHFQNDKTINLTFSYNPTDSLTQVMEAEGNFNIYRWESGFNKWIKYGGLIDSELNSVTYYVNRTGIYTILQNKDNQNPFIEANVEGQEYTQTLGSDPGQLFTNGGYISKDGIISFILMDSNGIDVFENPITLHLLDGSTATEIESSEYALTITPGNINQIPLKYQLNNLEKGTYHIDLRCHDVNGNYENLEIEFIVRDKFEVLNLANYPNPVKTVTVNQNNSGRTRFTYILTDNADKVNIKIYTVSGRLIKTFKNLPTSVGYHEYPRTDLGWDCRDKEGYFLANGVYFYRITAMKGNKKVEKTEKMAILK